MIVRLVVCASMTALLLVSCKTSYNPLSDYQQLHPATDLPVPAAIDNQNFSKADIEQGRYLVSLLGCGSCHTNGALVGAAHLDQLLAGSDTGIAWTNPLVDHNPGIVYPANLTPDIETGIGSWSAAEIIGMIKTGIDKHSGQTLPIMPWPSYAQIHDEDAKAIAAYLKSLPAVRHQVPKNVRQGQKASAPYIHFGVYQSKL
jgi:mono/diheme cytochrome c family protein